MKYCAIEFVIYSVKTHKKQIFQITQFSENDIVYKHFWLMFQAEPKYYKSSNHGLAFQTVETAQNSLQIQISFFFKSFNCLNRFSQKPFHNFWQAKQN